MKTINNLFLSNLYLQYVLLSVVIQVQIHKNRIVFMSLYMHNGENI